MDSTAAQKPHAICMPNPAQGHINPMLKLAKLLQSKGFFITFVHTETNYKRILKSDGWSSFDGADDFNFETIPDGLPPDDDAAAAQDILSAARMVLYNLSDPFRALVARINDASTSGVPPVTCIVSDIVTSFTLDVSVKLRIPNVFLCTTSANVYVDTIKIIRLHEKRHLPAKGEGDDRSTRISEPTLTPSMDMQEFLLSFAKHVYGRSHEASAVIINTFDALEPNALQEMSEILPPIYSIGPLSLLSHQSSSIWKEETHCLQWLNHKQARSVVYVSFGSLTVMTIQQLTEFAWGLGDSNHDFLWVVRPDLVKGERLSPEFLSETRGRGLMVSWCPQEKVLAHPAIGGFLTHCGWNSTIESMSNGVTMLCWPFFGDQPLNAKYVCREWGVGVEIEKDVRRQEVMVLVRKLMGGEEGDVMRKKALEWKEHAVRATEPGGSSFVNLDKVIVEVLLKKNQDGL